MRLERQAPRWRVTLVQPDLETALATIWSARAVRSRGFYLAGANFSFRPTGQGRRVNLALYFHAPDLEDEAAFRAAFEALIQARPGGGQDSIAAR